MGITLGKKQLNKGRVSLYLNYSYNGKRRKEYLGIILDTPTSAERRAENRNKVLIARQIRAHPIYLGGNFLILQKIYTFVP